MSLFWVGMTFSQTVMVRYIYGDEPGVGPQIYGQWELIDSSNNSQFYASGETVIVNPYENYTIKVSDGASTIEGGENDVSFLLYDEFQSSLNLSNGYLNFGTENGISVNYYDKIPIEFDVTADIEEVYIFDPWRWDEDGNNIFEFISVQKWLTEGDGEVFNERGVGLDNPIPPYYQLKAKRLVATSVTANDGIYRIENWSNPDDNYSILPIVDVGDPYNQNIPEYLTEDFHFVSPIVFNDGNINLNIFYVKVSETLEAEDKIVIFEGETLIIYPGSIIQFSSGIDVKGNLFIGENNSEETFLSGIDDEYWGGIVSTLNSRLHIFNSIISDCNEPILITGYNEYNPPVFDILIESTIFNGFQNKELRIMGVSDSESSYEGMINISDNSFDYGIIIGLNLGEVIIEDNIFNDFGRISSDWIFGDIIIKNNKFYTNSFSGMGTSNVIHIQHGKGIFNIEGNLINSPPNENPNYSIYGIFVQLFSNEYFQNSGANIFKNTIIFPQNFIGIMAYSTNEGEFNIFNNILYSSEVNEIGIVIDVENQWSNYNWNFNALYGIEINYQNFNNEELEIGINDLLINPELNEDFTLQYTSQCIDAGDPSIIDPDGTYSDIGAFYFHQTEGDINLNGNIDVIDILLLVDFILDNVIFDYNQLFVSDLNSDNEQDVIDILLLIQMILDQDINITNLLNVYLSGIIEAMEDGQRYKYNIDMLNEQDVYILHFKLQFENKIPLNIMKGLRSNDMTVSHVYKEDDYSLNIMVFSPEGRKITPGFGTIVEIELESTGLGRVGDLTDGSEFIITDLANNPETLIPVEIVSADELSRLADEKLNKLIPTKFALYPVYPNPFNPTATIRYDLPQESQVSLMVYDLNGRLIETLINSNQYVGINSVNWNAEHLPSGAYFIKLFTGEFEQIQKVILLK
ncbi:MAG: T9SS type A sorting domain-containing protein [Candidatus Marinimicrobia bacterium]|nr:T9SS type A sorting domain-containing protein [Candidatus Neomarinimicrobiota bacterium]